MTNEELNIKVAELKGFKYPCPSCFNNGYKDRWRNQADTGCVSEADLPRYTSDLNAAFSLLEGLNFMVFTCDFGYSCKIYTAPEHGEEELAEGFGDSVAVAICGAFVRLKGVKV